MYKIGQRLPWTAKGDFTFAKYILEDDAARLEDRLGFQSGRLAKGAIIAVMAPDDLNRLTTTDFSLGASTRCSRSGKVPAWAPEFAVYENKSDATQRMEPNAIESKLALQGQDLQQLKSKALNFMRTGAGNCPAKVFPLWLHEEGMTYPDARIGVPQFQLHTQVHWVVRRVLAAR